MLNYFKLVIQYNVPASVLVLFRLVSSPALPLTPVPVPPGFAPFVRWNVCT